MSDARQMVHSIGKELAAISSDEHSSRRIQVERIRRMYASHFDNHSIAKWVVGSAWRGATPLEREQFTALFEEYVVKSLYTNLARLKADRILVTNTKREGTGIVVVSYLVDPDPRAERSIEVIWRLSTSLKVYDVVVDKISLALSLRREISRMLERGGGSLPGLLAILTRKIASAAVLRHSHSSFRRDSTKSNEVVCRVRILRASSHEW